jgi:hypothetical protein
MTAVTTMAAAAVMAASAASTATGVDSGSTAAGVASTATASTAVAAAAAMADKLNHRRSVSLFVEDVKRRQANIGDFLLTEREVIRIIPWNIGDRTRR